MASSGPTLLRSIRRWDLVAVLINGVIGAGIFGLPSAVFRLSGVYSLLAFIVCAFCVAAIVFSLAEVSSRFSATGGPYLYSREAYGPLAGFTVGWLVWLARVTSFSANANLLPDYLDRFLPGIASGAPRLLFLAAVILLLGILNVRGIRRVTDASNIFTIGKLVPLAVFIVAGLFFIEPARFSFSSPPAAAPFSLSVMLLVYAFTGFEMALIPAGEVENPRRNLPVVLLIGMTVVVLFYVLIQAVCIGLLPSLGESKRPLSDAAAVMMGPWGAAMITAGIVFSLAGNLNVLILAASRNLFAMAEHGELPASLSRIHPRFRTPAFAVVLTVAVMLAVTLSKTFIYLLTISTIARLVAYGVSCSTLPVFRRRPDAAPAAWLAPAGPAIAVLAVALCLWLLSSSALREARDTAIALAIGLAIFALHRLRPRL